jgi:hypothetical protein
VRRQGIFVFDAGGAAYDGQCPTKVVGSVGKGYAVGPGCNIRYVGYRQGAGLANCASLGCRKRAGHDRCPRAEG